MFATAGLTDHDASQLIPLQEQAGTGCMRARPESGKNASLMRRGPSLPPASSPSAPPLLDVPCLRSTAPSSFFLSSSGAVRSSPLRSSPSVGQSCCPLHAPLNPLTSPARALLSLLAARCPVLRCHG